MSMWDEVDVRNATVRHMAELESEIEEWREGARHAALDRRDATFAVADCIRLQVATAAWLAEVVEMLAVEHGTDLSCREPDCSVCALVHEVWDASKGKP